MKRPKLPTTHTTHSPKSFPQRQAEASPYYCAGIVVLGTVVWCYGRTHGHYSGRSSRTTLTLTPTTRLHLRTGLGHIHRHGWRVFQPFMMQAMEGGGDDEDEIDIAAAAAAAAAVGGGWEGEGGWEEGGGDEGQGWGV